jgi:hypothetical protein
MRKTHIDDCTSVDSFLFSLRRALHKARRATLGSLGDLAVGFHAACDTGKRASA